MNNAVCIQFEVTTFIKQAGTCEALPVNNKSVFLPAESFEDGTLFTMPTPKEVRVFKPVAGWRLKKTEFENNK